MVTDTNLSSEVKFFILDQGADEVGIAPIERFAQAPEGYGPTDYMPDAACVISIGIHLADGICDAWGEYTNPGKTISPYLFYGYGLTNLELGRIANRAAKRLECQGFKTLTFPPTWVISMYRSRGLGHPKRADFSHRHAAMAAGLGEFGWNGLGLVPAHGSRVRFNSIITNAPLLANPMYEGPAICQPERCKFQCVRDCPAEALSATQKQQVAMDGRVFVFGGIDKARCVYGIFGLAKGSGGLESVDIPPGPGDLQHFLQSRANQDANTQNMLNTSFGIICGDFCGKCLHGCPAHLYSRNGQ